MPEARDKAHNQYKSAVYTLNKSRLTHIPPTVIHHTPYLISSLKSIICLLTYPYLSLYSPLQKITVVALCCHDEGNLLMMWYRFKETYN